MDFKIIEDLFNSYYGKNMSDLIRNHPQYGGYTNAAVVNVQDSLIERKIKQRNPYFKKDKMSDYQKAEYNMAVIEQIRYVLDQGDMDMMSGYNFMDGSLTDTEELNKRSLGRAVIERLENAGLFYRGLGHSCDLHWRY